jgi:hypothetical protein
MNTKKNIQRKTKKNISKRKRRTTNRSRVQKQVAGRDLGIKNFFRNLRKSNPSTHQEEEEDTHDQIFRSITPTFKKFYKIGQVHCDAGLESTIEDPNRYRFSRVKKLKQELAKEMNLNEEDVEIICENRWNAYYNIATKVFINYLPLTSDSKFKNMLFNVLQDLKAGKKVYITAFSFGSALANQLAMKLQELFESDTIDETTKQNIMTKLKINAYASINIAPVEKIKNINITNYLFLGDNLAQRFNHQIEPDPRDITHLRTLQGKEVAEEIWNKVLYEPAPANTTSWNFMGSTTPEIFTRFYKESEKERNSSVIWIDHYIDRDTRFIDYFYEKYGAVELKKKLSPIIHNFTKFYDAFDQEQVKLFFTPFLI